MLRSIQNIWPRSLHWNSISNLTIVEKRRLSLCEVEYYLKGSLCLTSLAFVVHNNSNVNGRVLSNTQVIDGIGSAFDSSALCPAGSAASSGSISGSGTARASFSQGLCCIRVHPVVWDITVLHAVSRNSYSVGSCIPKSTLWARVACTKCDRCNDWKACISCVFVLSGIMDCMLSTVTFAVF